MKEAMDPLSSALNHEAGKFAGTCRVALPRRVFRFLLQRLVPRAKLVPSQSEKQTRLSSFPGATITDPIKPCSCCSQQYRDRPRSSSRDPSEVPTRGPLLPRARGILAPQPELSEAVTVLQSPCIRSSQITRTSNFITRLALRPDRCPTRTLQLCHFERCAHMSFVPGNISFEITRYFSIFRGIVLAMMKEEIYISPVLWEYYPKRTQSWCKLS